MDFEDIFELLEAVRAYELRPGEAIIPLNHVTGIELGYVTADGPDPATLWKMGTKKAKASASARDTREGRRVRELLGSYMGRKELLERARKGSLQYAASVPQEESPVADPVPQEDSLTHEETPRKGWDPRQLRIPGLV